MRQEEAWQRRFRELKTRVNQFEHAYGRALGVAIPERGPRATSAIYQ
jgi:hypothetical protein